MPPPPPLNSTASTSVSRRNRRRRGHLRAPLLRPRRFHPAASSLRPESRRRQNPRVRALPRMTPATRLFGFHNILLRLSWEPRSLAVVSAVCRIWRRVVHDDENFLRSFRTNHGDDGEGREPPRLRQGLLRPPQARSEGRGGARERAHVSINPLDLRMKSGYGRCIFEPLLPLILGRDISGKVAATGTLVSSFSIGQEVYGALHPTSMRGTYADYAILSQDELTPKPSTHSCDKRALVIGGGGAVGLSAVQLAVAIGCSVSATCGAQSIEQLLAGGAEKAIDYTNEDTESTVKGKFDAVFT